MRSQRQGEFEVDDAPLGGLIAWNIYALLSTGAMGYCADLVPRPSRHRLPNIPRLTAITAPCPISGRGVFAGRRLLCFQLVMLSGLLPISIHGRLRGFPGAFSLGPEFLSSVLEERVLPREVKRAVFKVQSFLRPVVLGVFQSVSLQHHVILIIWKHLHRLSP